MNTNNRSNFIRWIFNLCNSFFDFELMKLRKNNVHAYLNGFNVYTRSWVPLVFISRIVIDLILIRSPNLSVQLMEIQLTASWLQKVVYYILLYAHSMVLYDWLRMRKVKQENTKHWQKLVGFYDYFEQGWHPKSTAAIVLARKHYLTESQAHRTLHMLKFTILSGLGAFLGFHLIISCMAFSITWKWILRGNQRWHLLPQLITGILMKYALNTVATMLGLSFLHFYFNVFFFTHRLQYLNMKLTSFCQLYSIPNTLPHQHSFVFNTNHFVMLKRCKKRPRIDGSISNSLKSYKTLLIPQIKSEFDLLINDLNVSKRLISVNFGTMFTASLQSATMYVFLIPLANSTDMNRTLMYGFFIFSIFFMILPPNLLGQMLINEVTFILQKFINRYEITNFN